ncbi:hypothetical protein BRADI_4g32583v3 [Brachypodium distachyon]|uniref:Uncharacterized protein n=1 Tax=Brachypodium distachyon TaxID=15368 RepID=A0A2K2CRT8_BRADI|nr:hypothetical protein BRADI_4g32583v3 [Brachypodium distachyon]
MVPTTTFLRGRDCHRAPLLAPCHGGVPRSGARTMRGVVFINNQPASARHHAKDERHVPTPAQIEASSSSIANRSPPEHRHARRSVVGWSLYIVPNLGGALPSSATAIIDNASLNTAAACAVVGDVYIIQVVRTGGRCMSAHSPHQLGMNMPPLVAAFHVVSVETLPRMPPALAHFSQRPRWHTLHQLGICMPPLVAAFYKVSVETPSYTAPVLVCSSPTGISTPPLMAAFHVVVCRDTAIHGARLGAPFTNSCRGLLHPRQLLHHRPQHQVYSLIHVADGIPASNHLPQHWRGEATLPTCLCTDEVHHHITCSCWAPKLGDGKTSCPVRRGGHFTGQVPTKRRPLHQPV